MIQVRWIAAVGLMLGTLAGCSHGAPPTVAPAPGQLATTSGSTTTQDSATARTASTAKPTTLTPAERDSVARARRVRRLRPPPKKLEITKAVADSLFPLAEARFRAGRYSSAQADLEKLTNFIRTGDPRFGRLHFLLGEAYLGQENHLQAARELRRVSDESGDEELAPSALLRVADSYAEMWRRPELDPSFANTAIATYQELQSRYPGTPAALSGQARISALQDKLAYKALRSGLYYYRLKAWDSAIIYFKDLVATYPRTSSAPLALVRLVQAYRVIGYQEDIKETCGYMRRFHANADGVADVCKGVPEA